MEPISLLHNKHILLGVTGGIAVYKICTLASRLTQAGAQVDTVMTKAANRFVAPLTFEALTGRPVYTDLWGRSGEGLPTHIAHVGLAHAADLLVVAPATANTMAKMAAGLADNLLTTLALAASCPVLIVPTMDAGMWSHAATQASAKIMRARGARFAGPALGRMASGLEGEGRMIEPDEILGHIRLALAKGGPLSGRHVVVTAGPTREPIDPVRYLSNPSSGRQGFALAQAALDRGARVSLISGPTCQPTPIGAERTDVTRAQDMHDAVIAAVQQADALLMSAAVADYSPSAISTQKIKKGHTDLSLDLARTPDILSAVAARQKTTGHPRIVVGFAAESENLVKNAREKLASKGMSLIVANDITVGGAGFASTTNKVVILSQDGKREDLPLMSKAAVANVILDRVIELFAAQAGGDGAPQ
jgi:phosphopantothenoylcysteine decarboxylase / phosphopantothenate---cysteine ligase